MATEARAIQRTTRQSPYKMRLVIDQIRGSDAVIWGFPLYILTVHAHYKRFIEEQEKA